MSYANLRRRAVTAPAQARADHSTIAAPTAGWVTSLNLAKADRKGAALILDNWFPTQTGIRLRAGSNKHATIGSAAVQRIFHYTGAADKLFAADATGIYDITSPADEDVAPDPVVSGQTNGYYSTQLFTTSGGTFLIAVNGEDNLLIFDGADWVPITGTNTIALGYDAMSAAFTVGQVVTGGTSGATGTILRDINGGTSGTLQLSGVSGTFSDDEALTDALTGAATVHGAPTTAGAAITGQDTDTLSHVWPYRNRLFFIEKGSLNAHYLPVDSIGGALGQRSLGGIFKHGGSLLFGATWSLDAGDGIDDKCVFVTDKGEMAVFEGSDPAGADPGDFDLVGRYDITVPLGKNATMSAGGDLLILSEDGIVPVSAAINKDAAALSLSAVTRPIEPEWQKQVRDRGGAPWEIVKWPSHNLALVSVPRTNANEMKYCFVVNIETGAWCRYTGWDVRSADIFNDKLYFGDINGVIRQGEVGGSDDGDAYVATYVGHAEHLKSPGAVKVVRAMRSVFTAAVAFDPQLSVSTDYVIDLPSDPNPAEVDGEGWDLSTWDDDVWDADAPEQTVATRWVSIGRTGFAVNPQVQVASASDVTPDAQLVSIDIMAERGGIMV